MGETTLMDGKKPEYDFVVCGGTLGIFVAASLQVLGKITLFSCPL
jgi:hypothetical protein